MRSILSWPVALAATTFCLSTFAAPSPLNINTDVTPAVRRDLYQLEGEDTAYRKQLIITAFYEALTLADGARNSRNDRIFKKYFRPEDRGTVNQVFSNILGANPKVGAPQLADIKVVFGDPHHLCQDQDGKKGEMRFDQGPPPTITVCEPLWTYTGITFEHISCLQLGNSVSLAMQTISSIVLHEFMHSALAAQSVPTQKIQDWSAQGLKQFGPQTALYIGKLHPSLALRSAANYEWYAVEVYWSQFCKKTYRNPRNELEAVRGTCGKQGCPIPNPTDGGL